MSARASYRADHRHGSDDGSAAGRPRVGADAPPPRDGACGAPAQSDRRRRLHDSQGSLATDLYAGLRAEDKRWEARYASATLLIIDDLHELAGKTATQQALGARCVQWVAAGASIVCG